MVEAYYRTSQVAKITGLSAHRIDRYVHLGLVKASVYDANGSGSHRLFNFTDLLQLKVVRKLLDLGVSLQKIRRAKDFIDTQLNKSLEGVVLFYDGETIYACNSENEIIDTLRHGQCILSIALGEMYLELRQQLGQDLTELSGAKISGVEDEERAEKILLSSA